MIAREHGEMLHAQFRNYSQVDRMQWRMHRQTHGGLCTALLLTVYGEICVSAYGTIRSFLSRSVTLSLPAAHRLKSLQQFMNTILVL